MFVAYLPAVARIWHFTGCGPGKKPTWAACVLASSPGPKRIHLTAWLWWVGRRGGHNHEYSYAWPCMWSACGRASTAAGGLCDTRPHKQTVGRPSRPPGAEGQAMGDQGAAERSSAGLLPRRRWRRQVVAAATAVGGGGGGGGGGDRRRGGIVRQLGIHRPPTRGPCCSPLLRTHAMLLAPGGGAGSPGGN